jgi:hypothetical protein
VNIKRPRVYKANRTIAEQPDGRWLIREWGRYYKTGTGAWKALKREAKAYAQGQPDGNYALVQIVTWVPMTKTGMAVIRAITE